NVPALRIASAGAAAFSVRSGNLSSESAPATPRDGQPPALGYTVSLSGDRSVASAGIALSGGLRGSGSPRGTPWHCSLVMTLAWDVNPGSGVGAAKVAVQHALR